MRMDELLLAVIREQLNGETPREETAKAITADILPRLYPLAMHHDMAHLVSAYLDKLNLSEDDPTVAAFKQAQLTQVFRHHRILAEQTRICAVLESACIPYLPLKGAVIRDMYPEGWYRPSCDIDILVGREDLKRAVTALVEKLGYSASDVEHFHDVDLYSKGGVHLELHFNILENMDNLDQTLRRVFDYATPVSDGGYALKLTDTFLVFHVVAHCYYHFLRGGCGIKPLMDLFVISNRGGLNVDENELRSLLEETNTARFYDVCLELVKVWFEGKPHTDLTERMARYILSGGVYGSVENTIAVKRNGPGRSRIGYLWSRIFMPYSDLKIKYPVLNKHPYLTPIMHIVRWFGLLSPTKRCKAMNEMRINSVIDGNRLQEVESLLCDLGIER